MRPASQLTVGRLAIEARVPRDQPVPPGMGSRLEALAREDLLPSLAATLAPACPDNDPTVWVIRRLEVDVMFDLGWSKDVVARLWAREIRASLTRLFHGGQ